MFKKLSFNNKSYSSLLSAILTMFVGILFAALLATTTLADTSSDTSQATEINDPMKPQWPNGRDPRLVKKASALALNKTADTKQGQVRLPPKAQQYILSSISIIGKSKRARINGTLVKEQQTIDGAKVIKIDAKLVKILVKGKERKLTIIKNRAYITEEIPK